MNDSTDDVIRDAIDRSPLFGHLSDKLRASLAGKAELQTYASGETVIEEGDQNQNHLYVVVDGEARVWTRAPKGTVELQRLESGEYFGEVSLLSEKVATATVEAAETPLKVVALAGKAVLDLVDRDETLRDALEGRTLERAKDTIEKVMK